MIDIVTVFYNEPSKRQAAELYDALVGLQKHGPANAVNFIAIDNRQENRGFAKACNFGAEALGMDGGGAEIIGFLNPDVKIHGPFASIVAATFARHRNVVVCGERFGKRDSILCAWGLRDWVCGACFFVRRTWFKTLGGFDEAYVWSWEETDFIRRSQEAGLLTKSITLPISHTSPANEPLETILYKQFHMANGFVRYMERWMGK